MEDDEVGLVCCVGLVVNLILLVLKMITVLALESAELGSRKV